MYKIGQKVCEKINNVIHWGIIVDKFGEKYRVHWEESRKSIKGTNIFTFTSFVEERDIIPEGDPAEILKEIL